jgi:hypothetical protein
MVSAALPPMRPIFIFVFLRTRGPRGRKASKHVPPHRLPAKGGSCGASAFGASLLLPVPPTAGERRSNTRMPAPRRQRSARVRIPCELAESEIASTESPSCSMTCSSPADLPPPTLAKVGLFSEK